MVSNSAVRGAALWLVGRKLLNGSSLHSAMGRLGRCVGGSSPAAGGCGGASRPGRSEKVEQAGTDHAGQARRPDAEAGAAGVAAESDKRVAAVTAVAAVYRGAPPSGPALAAIAAQGTPAAALTTDTAAAPHSADAAGAAWAGDQPGADEPPPQGRSHLTRADQSDPLRQHSRYATRSRPIPQGRGMGRKDEG